MNDTAYVNKSSFMKSHTSLYSAQVSKEPSSNFVHTDTVEKDDDTDQN